MRLASRLRPAWCALLVAAMAATTKAAAVPPVVPLGHRIAERLPFLVGTLAHEAPVLGVEIDAVTTRECATAGWGDVCRAMPVQRARRMARRCRRLLSVADAALERSGGPTDGMRGLAAMALRQAIATEAMRLSAFLRALSLGGCERVRDAGEPVTLTLLDDGRRVLVEPERGLDPTRRWAIRTTDSGGTMLQAKAGAAMLPDVPALSAARALAGKWEGLARDAPHWPAFPAFVVELAEAAPTRPFWHPPVRLQADPTGNVAPRDPREAFRRPSDPARCPSPAKPTTALQEGLRRHDAIGEVRRGALEPGLSFLVALPRTETRGVVLLVHSLEADGRTMLDLVGDDLANVGLATVAFDLPLHGERARQGEPFLAADDPTRFARNALAAVGDVLALTAMVRHCPAAAGLPSGVATDRVGFLGYSIGATLGLLALGADPALAPAVLLAPAGDIQRWQALLLARHIDVIDTVCIGPDGGDVCADDASCGPGAVCDRHPGLFLIAPAVLPPSRLLIGDAEPLGVTAFLRPPIDERPILVQYANEDTIVFPSQTRLVADALALPLVAADAELPSRALRAWSGGHEFITQPAVRAEAARFLARHSARAR